jgi:uncharacterized membrane protein HdeD (DUF308 family)
METKTNKNWWFLAINGLVAILIGLMFLFLTRPVIFGIVGITGLAIAALGLILLIIAIYQLKKDKSAALTILLSICFLAVGLGIKFYPEPSLHMFFILLGIWAVITGIFQLIILVNIKRNLSNKNIILFNGLLTIALGVILFFSPENFAEFLFKLIGIFAAVFGIMMIYLSLVIRKTTSLTDSDKEQKK